MSAIISSIVAAVRIAPPLSAGAPHAPIAPPTIPPSTRRHLLLRVWETPDGLLVEHHGELPADAARELARELELAAAAS